MNESCRKSLQHDSPEQFIKLVYKNQRRIFAFILTLVPNYIDAEDIMQDCLGVMWRKFSTFESGTDFASWGMKIAHYIVLDYRRKNAKDSINYDSRLFEAVAREAARSGARTDRRVEALQHCIKRLREKDRNLVRLRYFESVKPRQIASQLNISIANVYKSLSRINSRLLTCVQYVMDTTS